MASTSNQETFRADVDGRLVFDILRHVGPFVLTVTCPARDASCRAASDVLHPLIDPKFELATELMTAALAHCHR